MRMRVDIRGVVDLQDAFAEHRAEGYGDAQVDVIVAAMEDYFDVGTLPEHLRQTFAGLPVGTFAKLLLAVPSMTSLQEVEACLGDLQNRQLRGV